MDNAVIKVIGIGTAGNEVLNKIAHRKISGVEIAGIDTNHENLNKEVEVALQNSDLVFILMEMSEKKNSEITTIVGQTAKAKGILTITVAVTSVNSNGETEEIEKLKEVSDTVIVLSLKKLAEADPSATFDKIFEKRDESFIKNVEFIAINTDRQILYRTYFTNGNGYWKDYYYKEGKTREEGKVVDHYKYGEWKYYNENGKIDSIKAYQLSDSVDVRFPHCLFNKNEPCY